MKFRHAVRALLVSPESRILLMKLQLKNPDRAFWIAPGGGVEQGEDLHNALCREIFEETGNRGVRIGPLVWRRQHEFKIEGESVHQFEEFFLCRTVDEIRQSQEVFVPRALFYELTKLLNDGFDGNPKDVGV